MAFRLLACFYMPWIWPSLFSDTLSGMVCMLISLLYKSQVPRFVWKTTCLLAKHRSIPFPWLSHDDISVKEPMLVSHSKEAFRRCSHVFGLDRLGIEL